MELYTLDPLLRREAVIDSFESLIWTERYDQWGDFQLSIPASNTAWSLLREDTRLAMNLSHRVMVVETIEKEDRDGRKMLTIKGRSLEKILEDRVAKESLSNLETSPKWIITGLPAAVARKVFHDICVDGILDQYDVIPYIVEGSFLPDDNLPEPTDTITVELDPQSVYDVVSEICNVWGLGFRLLRRGDLSQLYFNIYSGSNRTSAQALLPAVIFTPELDNLQNTKELTSTENYRNVAYVYSPAGVVKVYAPGVDPEVAGFERRILPVKIDSIDEGIIDITAFLTQRGNEELAKQRVLKAFDGEISQDSQFVYGRDYSLGDIVESRSDNGNTNNMRVTEQIFVQDQEGERSYPTLSTTSFITPGSWLSWVNNKVWADMGPTEYWSNQP